jgi:hypothetical protein
MNNKIIDEMRKEGKPFRNIMLFGYIFAILIPLSIYLMNNDKYSDKDIILFAIAGVMFGTIGLYGWLYSIKYRLEFDNEKVYLKTLFRKIKLNLCDIKKYTCSRYRKSVFYQFNLFINDKKVLINTRYKDEFEKVLKEYKIEQIIK